MIKCFCHPALHKLLDQIMVKVMLHQALVDFYFISDFYPQVSNQIHNGLIEAVTYRLTHPFNYILLLSFYSKEKLLQIDTLGILSLQGTVFMRLPFLPVQLSSVIDKYTEKELSIPEAEWQSFSTYAFNTLLREKLSALNHGSKLDLINSITGPLRAAAVGSSSSPELLPVIKQHLQSIKSYNTNKEITELLLLSNASASLSDPFFHSVKQFVKGLQNLEKYSLHEEININQLIYDIDILNETLQKIQSQ